MRYNLAVVSQLVNAAFSDDDLSNFCFENYELVYNQFTAGQTKGARVRLLVEYAQRRALLAELLDRVHEVNPGQYQRFEPQLKTAFPAFPVTNWYMVVAGMALLVVVLAGIYTAPLIFRKLWPDPLPLITTPRISGEYLVLVADYKGQGNFEAGRRIFDLLSEKAVHLGKEGKLRVAWQPGIVIDSFPNAQVWGEKHASTAVIWGWYDEAGIQSYFHLIDANLVPLYNLSEEPFDNENSLKQYVRSELPTVASYLAFLGIGLFAAYQEDSVNGLVCLDLAEDVWATVAAEEQRELRDKGLGQGDLRWYRAWIYTDVLNDDQHAIAEYQRALEIEGRHVPLAHYQLAMAYKRLENWNSALEHLKIFTELGSNMPDLLADVYKQMGDVLHELHLSAEAEAAYDKATKLDPKNAIIPLARGWYAYQLGDLAVAESYYHQAINLDPMYPWPHLNLALIYLLSNKKNEAIQAYKTALPLAEEWFLDPIPEYQSARKDLDNLLGQHPELTDEAIPLYQMLEEALKKTR